MKSFHYNLCCLIHFSTAFNFPFYRKPWVHTDASNAGPTLEFILFCFPSISILPFIDSEELGSFPYYISLTNPFVCNQSPIFVISPPCICLLLLQLWLPILSHLHAALSLSNTHGYLPHPSWGPVSIPDWLPAWTSSLPCLGSASRLWGTLPIWHPPHHTWALRLSHWAAMAPHCHPLDTRWMPTLFYASTGFRAKLLVKGSRGIRELFLKNM